MPATRRRLTSPAFRLIAALVVAWLITGPANAQCTGDCDENGAVGISELIRAVGIALGQGTVATCPAIDSDDSGTVSIAELIAAVGALLGGCPGAATTTPSGQATPTPPATHTPSTPTETPTVDPTPTATVNQPPVLPTASIYRTFPGFPIRVVLNPTDPEGGMASCAVENLPAGATFDEEAGGVLSWTPAEDQLGAFYLPYTCSDEAEPPAAARGQLAFRVSQLDPCSIPSCDPATGCTVTLKPLTERCCTDEPVARVPEVTVGCPADRILHIGQRGTGFGRIQNCDVLVVTNFEQSGAEVRFNLETRCISTLTRIGMTARMESDASRHPLIFDVLAPRSLYARESDGFDRRRGYRVDVAGGGPFTDMQGAEANLSVTIDNADVSVTEQVRVRLSFTPQPDLPDVDPTRPPTPTPTHP